MVPAGLCTHRTANTITTGMCCDWMASPPQVISLEDLQPSDHSLTINLSSLCLYTVSLCVCVCDVFAYIQQGYVIFAMFTVTQTQ